MIKNRNLKLRKLPSLYSIFAAAGLAILIFANLASGKPCASDSIGNPVITVECGKGPSATMDSSGRLWVTFVHDNNVYIAHSDTLGRSFSDPVQVNHQQESIEFNGENRPKILIADDGTILLSWTLKTSNRFTGEIRFTRSRSGGKKFEPVRTINDDNLFTGHRFESLFLTESQHLYVTWIDKRDLETSKMSNIAYSGAAIYYAVSDDLGASWSPNYRVAHNSCECCRIATASRGESDVAILWRHIFEDSIRDHAISTINPTGKQIPIDRATVDNWQINACPHHGPAMTGTSNDDEFHMAWFSNGTSNQGINYAKYSFNEQVSYNKAQIDARPGAGHPDLANIAGALHLVWKGFDGERTELLHQVSYDGGANWTPRRLLYTTTENSDYPLLVSFKKKVYLSWHSDEHGYRFDELTSDPTLSPPKILPFTSKTLSTIRANFKGKPFLMNLWSVDCAPCRIELEMIGKLKAKHPNFPIAIISTDSIKNYETSREILEDYGLENVTTWAFAESFVEPIRHSIDNTWFGELPRTYFYNDQKQREAHSGVLTQEQLDRFSKLVLAP